MGLEALRKYASEIQDIKIKGKSERVIKEVTEKVSYESNDIDVTIIENQNEHIFENNNMQLILTCEKAKDNDEKLKIIENKIIENISNGKNSTEILEDCFQCIILLTGDKSFYEAVKRAQIRAFQDKLF